jgi:hypothetical protein
MHLHCDARLQIIHGPQEMVGLGDQQSSVRSVFPLDKEMCSATTAQSVTRGILLHELAELP